MLTIKKVTVTGTSVKGNFGGTINLDKGLQIISADNKFGKTLIATSIAWCLNLEATYGNSNADNSIFRGGILDRVDLEDLVDVPVLTLIAEIEIATRLGREYRLSRSVVGGDRKVIEVQDGLSENTTKHLRLITGFGALSDSRAGFQAWLFSVVGLPVRPVINKDGAPANLYFENIAPLFFIEQLRGWVGLQSRQVHRYRIEEVEAVALEYILGLDNRLRRRISNQAHASRDVALRIEIISIVKEFIKLLDENGWTDPRPPAHGGLESLSHTYVNFRFIDYLRDKFNYDHGAENRHLLQTKAALQKKINEGQVAESNRETFSVQSARIIELRRIKQNRNEELSNLRNQKLNQEDVLRVLSARQASAKDLRRLKQHNIGQIGETECPTCHRAIIAEELHVTTHTIEEVDIHIDSLEKEMQLIKGSLAKIEREIQTSLIRADKVDGELHSAERGMGLISQTIGMAKEAIVKLSYELAEIDNRIEKNDKLQERIETLQRQLDAWVTRVRQHENEVALPTVDESPRLESFLEELRLLLVSVGHGALSDHDQREVYLDESYNPCINSRQLARLGSASDAARLVFAYVVALLKTARERGRHPGFLVLDEPLQQNTDRKHRDMIIELLGRKWFESDGQIIILTHVLPAESRRLRQLSAPLREMTDRRFLKLTKGLPDKSG